MSLGGLEGLSEVRLRDADKFELRQGPKLRGHKDGPLEGTLHLIPLNFPHIYIYTYVCIPCIVPLYLSRP